MNLCMAMPCLVHPVLDGLLVWPIIGFSCAWLCCIAQAVRKGCTCTANAVFQESSMRIEAVLLSLTILGPSHEDLLGAMWFVGLFFLFRKGWPDPSLAVHTR